MEQGVTSGTGKNTFSPNASCTRGQIVTFLWNSAGKPEPSSTENPFVDVKESDYYYKAMLWAAEQKITSGTDATHFSPSKTCTRADAMTFIWRYEGQPAASGSGFSDVPANAYYQTAGAWAVANSVTSGVGDNRFGSAAECTRGQIVTFLYRYMA